MSLCPQRLERVPQSGTSGWLKKRNANDNMLSLVNKETGEVVTVMDEEFRAAEERDDDLKALYGLIGEGIRIAGEILSDESNEKYIALPSKFEIHEWDIMKRFCLSIEDKEISESLSNAIHGTGAFRYFNDSIHRFGIADEWHKYRDTAIRQIAIDWCEKNNIEYIED